jgi:hypothetical protein
MIFLLLSFFVEILKRLCNVNHQPIIKDLYPIVSRERKEVGKKKVMAFKIRILTERKRRESLCVLNERLIYE